MNSLSELSTLSFDGKVSCFFCSRSLRQRFFPVFDDRTLNILSGTAVALAGGCAKASQPILEHLS